MPYIPETPSLDDMLGELRTRVRKLEQSVLEAQGMASNPSTVHDGMIWLRSDIPMMMCGVGGFVPPGAIMGWPLPTPPLGWLAINGQTIAAVDYPDLFPIVRVAMGLGPEVTTLTLPDWSGRTMFGIDPSDSTFASFADTGGQLKSDTTSVSATDGDTVQDSYTDDNLPPFGVGLWVIRT